MEEINELKAELESERETIEDLLNQLQTMELEGRAMKEESDKRENHLKSELSLATRNLEDERAIRLQQMYMLSRVKEECEAATAEMKEMQLSRDAQNKEFDQLEASLRLTKKLLLDRDNDLRETTEANLILKTEALHLQKRLVEADQETTHWRRKYETLVDTAKEIAQKQQQVTKPSYANVKNTRGGRGVGDHKSSSSRTRSNQDQRADMRTLSSSSLPSVFDRRSR